MLDPIKDVVRLSGLPDPALHALLGLAIYLVAAIVLRRGLGSWLPWLITLGVQLVNEVADIGRDLLDGEIFRWRGSLIDTVVTIAMPTLLLLIGKLYTASRTRSQASPPADEAPPTGDEGRLIHR